MESMLRFKSESRSRDIAMSVTDSIKLAEVLDVKVLPRLRVMLMTWELDGAPLWPGNRIRPTEAEQTQSMNEVFAWGPQLFCERMIALLKTSSSQSVMAGFTREQKLTNYLSSVRELY
jgi:hypothetical protein